MKRQQNYYISDMQTLLRFGAPETGTSLSDTEGDHGKEFHQDLPHDKPLERDELWGEPMDKGEVKL